MGKDSESDQSPTPCDEALTAESPAVEVAEQAPPVPRKEAMEQRRYEGYMTSDSFVRLVLTDFEVRSFVRSERSCASKRRCWKRKWTSRSVFGGRETD